MLSKQSALMEHIYWKKAKKKKQRKKCTLTIYAKLIISTDTMVDDEEFALRIHCVFVCVQPIDLLLHKLYIVVGNEARNSYYLSEKCWTPLKLVALTFNFGHWFDGYDKQCDLLLHSVRKIYFPSFTMLAIFYRGCVSVFEKNGWH